MKMNTRREFLGWMAGAAVMLRSRPAWESRPYMRSGEGTSEEAAPKRRPYTDKMEVPEVLDHILLGCGDLERGIAFVEERTGVRAAFGGVHPGRGTQNALLSLGTRHYLEIIAPDPKQAALRDPQSSVERLKLRELAEPRLVTWAAHPGGLAALAEKLAKAGVAADGPTTGSRKRPDGRVLLWKTLNLKEDEGGALPFFIEWSAESVHPSVDAPKGCALEKFWVESPAAEEFAKRFSVMGVEVEVTRGERVRLRARIAGPKGEMELSS